MSRHRAIPRPGDAYDDDGASDYDGDYGSYEESPLSASMEKYVFHRHKEDREVDLSRVDEEDFSPLDEEAARRAECYDAVHSALFGSVSDAQVREVAELCNYDTNATVSRLLSMEEVPLKPAPPTSTTTNVLNEKLSSVSHNGAASLTSTVHQSYQTKPHSLDGAPSPTILENHIAHQIYPPKHLAVDAAPRASPPASRPILSPSAVIRVKKLPGKSPSMEKARSVAAASEKQRDMVELEKLRHGRYDGRSLLNLVIVGHVDAGKSTLMGNTLVQLGEVEQRQMHKHRQEAKKLGKASFEYAFVLDESEEERARGVTMDVGRRYFRTSSHIVHLLDTPGHKDFIPRMITGATQADAAILVVDARVGEFESGFESGGQTREHALLLRSLGLTQLAVAVNKMDAAEWSETRYQQLVDTLLPFLTKLRLKPTAFVPVSGLTGINLTPGAVGCPELAWYSGPCLLDVIDSFTPATSALTDPMRCYISDYTGTTLQGVVCSGCLHADDPVLLLPVNKPFKLKELTLDDEPVAQCFPGDHVQLVIPGLEPDDVSPGSVLTPPSLPCPVTQTVRASVLLFELRIPLTRGTSLMYHSQQLAEECTVSKLISETDKSSGAVKRSKPKCLISNSSGHVEIRFARALALDEYRNCRALGRFLLRSSGETIAAGMITTIK